MSVQPFLLECPHCQRCVTRDEILRDPASPSCPHCRAAISLFDQETMFAGNKPLLAASSATSNFAIEGYEILAKMGEGGMGIVYAARQISLDRKVAIKVLPPSLAEDPGFVAGFAREVAALVRLAHPHIVRIFDQGRSAGGLVYYIMEYVEGDGGGPAKNLENLINERALDSTRTRDLLTQIVQALGFAHREGIIHRDVKPANVLVDKHGFAHVADFGIASMHADPRNSKLTTANISAGTAIYMSPEQSRDAASVDPRSDIYSTGVMLYEMLTGELPLPGRPLPSVVVSGLSPQWDAIVTKAIQPRPENRFASMQEFEAALVNLGRAGVEPPPSAIPVRSTVSHDSQSSLGPRPVPVAAAKDPGNRRACPQLAIEHQSPGRGQSMGAVSQIVAELRKCGVPVKGLNEYTATVQQRLAMVDSRCWPRPGVRLDAGQYRQGPVQAQTPGHSEVRLADHGEALEIRQLASASPAYPAFPFRIPILAIIVSLVAICGRRLLLPDRIARSRESRATSQPGRIRRTIRIVGGLNHRLLLLNSNEVTYLQGGAELKRYASAAQEPDPVLLDRSQRHFEEVFGKAREVAARAATEFGKAVMLVPAGAPMRENVAWRSREQSWRSNSAAEGSRQGPARQGRRNFGRNAETR